MSNAKPKLIHGMTPVEFDTMVASRYGMKTHDAQNRGKDFQLTLAQFRSLYTRKRCAYTGVLLTYKRDENGNMPPNFATLERVDNLKGYVMGNVVIVAHEANKIKSVFESKCGTIDVRMAVKMFANIGNLLSQADKTN